VLRNVEIWKFYRNLTEITNLASKFSNFEMSLTDFASEGPFATTDTFINIKLSKNITRVILAKAKVPVRILECHSLDK